MQLDPALACARWFKATASSGDQGCVEIAHLDDGRVALRDSKTPTTRPHLHPPRMGLLPPRRQKRRIRPPNQLNPPAARPAPNMHDGRARRRHLPLATSTLAADGRVARGLFRLAQQLRII